MKKLTGLALGTINELANDVSVPHSRTIRDVQAAVDQYEAGALSDSERKATA